MKRSKKLTYKQKKKKFGTIRKWLEAKRHKKANKLNAELNRGKI